MVDKEKAKLRKAKEAAASGEGDDDGATPMNTPTTGGKSKVRAKTPPFDLHREISKLADPLLTQKRAATEEAATPSASAKKRAPRKSKKALQAEADAAEAGEQSDEHVKTEAIE